MPDVSPQILMTGYSQLRLLAKHAGPEVKQDLDIRLRGLAEPMRADAEEFALRNISGLRKSLKSSKWAEMRVGVTRRVVYVAPKKRGVKTRGPDPRRRPNLATRLDEDAMTPALDRNKDNLEAGAEGVLAGFALRWNRLP